MSDTEDEKTHLTVEYLGKLESMNKELSTKLDEIYDRQFRHAIVQPVLVVVLLLLTIVFYLFLPVGLIFVIVVCFLFSWSFPALQVPMWLATVLLLTQFIRAMSTQFTVAFTPVIKPT